MEEAARLRAQKAFSTDPDYLERMALAEEARAGCEDESRAFPRTHALPFDKARMAPRQMISM
jgi:hypothetical protein